MKDSERKPMKKIKVESSNINYVSYDEKFELLIIEFYNDSVYAYAGVPKEIYEKLMKSESVGKTFHSLIRDKYLTERMK